MTFLDQIDQQQWRLKTLNNFWGYGNPKTARILFIGIEESGSWTKNEMSLIEYNEENKVKDDDELIPLVNDRLNIIEATNRNRDNTYLTKNEWTDEKWSRYVRPPEQFKITEKIQTYISLKLQGKQISKLEDPRLLQYWQAGNNREKKYGFCSAFEFQANIFPLGAPSQDSWPKEYAKYFGVQESKQKYREHCKCTRLSAIKKLIKTVRGNINTKTKNPLIFIMGSEPREYTKQILGEMHYEFPQNNIERLSGRRCYSWSECSTIWLVGHPSHGWITQDISDKIINRINDLGVNPFPIIQ